MSARFCRPLAAVLALAFAAVIAAAPVRGGESGLTAEEFFGGTPPGPTGLEAVVREGFVLLSWQAPQPLPAGARPTYDPAVARYRVLRRTGAGDYELLAEADTTAWEDRGVLRGRTYTYAVLALQQDGRESAFSDPVTVVY